MSGLLATAWSIHKPVEMGFDEVEQSVARTVLCVRATALTTLTTIAWKALRFLISRYSGSTTLPSVSLKPAPTTLLAVTLLAFAFFKIESIRGIYAFQLKLANEKGRDLNDNELAFIASNPEAVVAALRNNTTFPNSMLKAILLKGNHFYSFKSFVDYLMDKDSGFGFSKLLMTIESGNAPMVEYALKTVAGLKNPSVHDIYFCWRAAKTDSVAKALKTHGYDVNNTSESTHSILGKAILDTQNRSKDSLERVSFLIRHGALFSTSATSERDLNALRGIVNGNNELKKLFENDPAFKEPVVAN